MTRTISLITAVAGLALVLAAPSLGKGQPVGEDFWNYDQQGRRIADTSPGMSGADLAFLYASTGTDARVAPLLRLDIVDRTEAARRSQEGAIPTAGQRLVFDDHRIDGGATSAGRSLVFDDYRHDPVSQPVEIAVTDSGIELEWPQIGVAFGIGIALMLGLFLTLRLAHVRPLAH